ncbi:MAG: VCBS repeat-containing protein, partial [Betaproteobacteria bacterium]
LYQGGPTANQVLSALVQGLQDSLGAIQDENGQPRYALIAERLPSIGYQYDPDGYNIAGGAPGHLTLQWSDEQGQTQTRYYDGQGRRIESSGDTGETLAGDFALHAQGAIAPLWQVQTLLAHEQAAQTAATASSPGEAHGGPQAPQSRGAGSVSSVVGAQAPVMSLPQQDADGLHQRLRVLSLDIGPPPTAQPTAPTALIDVDGDGYLEQSQWLASNQAVLVLDWNGDGRIDAGEWLNKSSLDWLDANGDGRIDANDPAFAALRLWLDVNADGQSAASELQGLGQAQISAIDFAHSPPSVIRGQGAVQTSEALTEQNLASETLGVRYQMTDAGLLLLREQTDGSGLSELEAINTQALNGQPESVHGGGADPNGSTQAVSIGLADPRLFGTSNNSVSRSSAQSSSTIGVGDARLLSRAPSGAAAASASTVNGQQGLVFVPVGQTSAQTEWLRVTQAIIHSADSSLGTGLNLGVLGAVGIGMVALQTPALASALDDAGIALLRDTLAAQNQHSLSNAVFVSSAGLGATAGGVVSASFVAAKPALETNTALLRLCWFC